MLFSDYGFDVADYSRARKMIVKKVEPVDVLDLLDAPRSTENVNEDIVDDD